MQFTGRGHVKNGGVTTLRSRKGCPTTEGVGVTRNLVRRFLGVGFVSMAVCLVALTFALPQTAHAVIDPTAVTGIVTDGATTLPVEDAMVELINGAGDLVAFDFTTVGGVYALTGVPVGTYTLEITAENYEPYIMTGFVFDGATVPWNVALDPYPLAFEGTITDAAVPGQAIEGVRVSAWDPATPGLTYDAITDQNGAYEVFAPAGTYDVEFLAISYAATEVAGVKFDGVDAVVRDVALVKNPLAFTGTVTDSVTDEPIEGAGIYAYTEEGEFVGEAYSDINGEYEMYAPAGTLDLSVEAEFYHQAYANSIVFDGVNPITKSFALVPPTVTRIAGKNRYETAEQIARKGWDPKGDMSWDNVTDIIIANGEAGKEADPVTAAGLAGAYDAPVLLTQASVLPPATKKVITEIALKNPGVQIHIIGGKKVVPDARWKNMKSIKGVSTLEHRVAGNDRFETSVKIAEEIIEVYGADGLGGFILIAGDNPAAFYDGLAASPISYINQMPMLSVMKNSVPSSVATFLARKDLQGYDYDRFAASSSAYIGSVPARGAIRMTKSQNRYTAAADIADFALFEGMTGEQDVALASGLPDALTGGAFVGRRYGVLLFTDTSKSLQYSPKTFIQDYAGVIMDGWVIGGTAVLQPAQETTFRNLIR